MNVADSFLQGRRIMYYASIGILALILHLITNFDVLKKSTRVDTIPVHRAYRRFLLGVIAYYLIDILWGVLYALDFYSIFIATAATELYFLIMVLTVFLWTRYVIAYLRRQNAFSRMLYYIGWIFIAFQVITLIINPFKPVVFWYDEEGYHTCFARYISHFMQFGFFLMTTLHMLLMVTRTQGKIRYRHLTVGAFGLVMTSFVILQSIFPAMPFFSMGYMIGTTLLHTFVLEAEKEARQKALEAVIKKEKKQEKELDSAWEKAYTDPLTGVKNKFAYLEEESRIEEKIMEGTLKNFALIVFDLNGLKDVNDTKGHDEGDRYIKQGCDLICQIFKRSPVFRIGGDEFVAFLEGENYKNRESLLKDFNRQIEKNYSEGKVVVSSGLDEFLSGDDNFLSVFERADKKMYERKRLLKQLDEE